MNPLKNPGYNHDLAPETLNPDSDPDRRQNPMGDSLVHAPSLQKFHQKFIKIPWSASGDTDTDRIAVKI